MLFFSKIKQYAIAAAAGLGLSASLASCDSWIYNYEEDCNYYVRFVYDYNLKWANAFPNEVKSVTLYVIDENDSVVFTKSENSDDLAKADYRMEISPDDVKPGRYRLLAWAGDEEIGSYPKTDGPKKAHHHRRLERTVNADGAHHHHGEMDRLYHGSLPSNLNCELAKKPTNVVDGYCIFSDGYRDEFTVPMMKNTNTIRIHLQQIGGEPMPVEKFEFSITDQNGHMDADNNLSRCPDASARSCADDHDAKITYHPWALKSGTTDLTLNGQPTSYGTALAEFTTSRLMESNQKTAILSIKNHEGEEIVKLPVLQALLLAKGEYYQDAIGKADVSSSQAKPLSDQEFFDRQDTYNLTFFLDEHSRWTSAEIFIESWKVIWQETEL